MRVMVMLKATPDSEAGAPFTTELLEAMGAYNQQLIDAGVMTTGDGLRPTSVGARVRIDGAERRVAFGPFLPVEEQVAGFWLWDVPDLASAIDWVKRMPNPMPGPSDVDIRPLYEDEDYGDAWTPELLAVADAHRRTLERRGQ